MYSEGNIMTKKSIPVRAVVIDNDKVVNVIKVDKKDVPKNLDVVITEDAMIGDLYDRDNGKFIQPIEEVQIDNTITPSNLFYSLAVNDIISETDALDMIVSKKFPPTFNKYFNSLQPELSLKYKIYFMKTERFNKDDEILVDFFKFVNYTGEITNQIDF